MKIRFTSVTWSDIGPLIRNVMVMLEDALNPIFANNTFGGGVDQFTTVVVAIDSNSSENDKFCKAHNRVGIDKNPITGKKIKNISVALPFDPGVIKLMTEDQVCLEVCSALINRLNDLGLKKIPKEFNFAKFAIELRDALKIVMHG